MLEWVFRRCDDAAEAATPRSAACRRRRARHRGARHPDEQLEAILAVDVEWWKQEIQPIREFFDKFGDRLPPEVAAQLDALEERLNEA